MDKNKYVAAACRLAMSSQSVADRRRQVLVGELPPDFLRLIVPREQEATSFPQQQLVYAGGSFVPPNTRGRVSITIADANLVRNYGIKAFGADECVAWAHVMLPQAIFSGETIDDYYPLSGQQGEGKEGMLT
ncbi:hypothetical protein ANCCAN_22278 [Ancylostoma caninum]|uniref:Uncharacterized protein n=1 Tax=Ancylostoma caninum TaxID=29170 RepID=A0A368FLQ0_ANCCA|nr:hypothetical protein ANCCAN_22278 [Ancylostoma caninum]